MATIKSSAPDKTATIRQFKGLNECRDGDTKLALGEASTCLNWKVTRDGNLQRRPGYMPVATLGDAEVIGLWSGWVNGYEYIVAANNGQIKIVYDGMAGSFPSPALTIGTYNSAAHHVHMFGFDSKMFIMDGYRYQVWDGIKTGTPPAYPTASDVVGYVPLVADAIGPIGTAEEAGELLEQVNKLTASRRVWISPDGTNSSFRLPEKGLASIDYVKDLATGTELSSGWTPYTATGIVTFTSAPPLDVNSYEIGYTAALDYRSQVVAMRYSELYSGETDSRVFIYGDGTNELFYSDIDYNGKSHADYFPDMNHVAVGDANTPVTGLIRHYSRLICYKLDSTWTISTNTMTLADGSMILSFNVIPVNRIIGNEAPGQVQLVLNSPRTLFQNELYEWHGSSRTGNLTNDERQAYRISDRIYSTLRDFSLSNCVCFDDNANQEYYIVYNGIALVNNYAVNAWYKYDSLNATCFCSFDGETYFGTENGGIFKMSEQWKKDTLFYGVNTWTLGQNDFTADDDGNYYAELDSNEQFTSRAIDLTDNYVIVPALDSTESAKLTSYGITGMKITVIDDRYFKLTTVGGQIEENVGFRLVCRQDVAIDARWESGSMDFGADYMRKYSSVLWVSVKPQTNSYVEISIKTDRKDDFASKVVALGTGGFATWDFNSFSFNDNVQPQAKKLRLKAKKFEYYTLIFMNDKLETTATVLAADIRTRQTGYAK